MDIYTSLIMGALVFGALFGLCVIMGSETRNNRKNNKE